MLPYLRTWRSWAAFAITEAPNGIQRPQMPDPSRELPRRDPRQQRRRRRRLTGAGIVNLPAGFRRRFLVELPPKQRGGGAAPPSTGTCAALSRSSSDSGAGECGVTDPASGLGLPCRSQIGVVWWRQGFGAGNPREAASGSRHCPQRHSDNIEIERERE
ncbi:hypothetical protein BHE74_00057138 [Ensete ventricosum]|nr:hypothetical protein BHE74_00057138 [Ensete ventricosum]